MKKIFYIISFVLLLSLAGIGGFFIGKSTNQPVIGTTFYAVIDDIRDQNIWVSGLDVNDINSRGEFYYHRRYNKITMAAYRNIPIRSKSR